MAEIDPAFEQRILDLPQRFGMMTQSFVREGGGGWSAARDPSSFSRWNLRLNRASYRQPFEGELASGRWICAMLEVEQRQRLSNSAHRLLNYIEQHPNAVLVSSALDLAAKIDASDATVIRAIQSLGFDGLPHLKTAIAEKLDEGVRTPVEKVSVILSELTQERSRTPFQVVIEAYAAMLDMLSRSPLSEQLEAAVRLLNDADRIGLCGGGPPIRLAQQTATHLGRIGRASFVMEGSGHAFADALLGLRPGDAVILIAYGKVLKESLLIKAELQRVGGQLVVITDNPGGRLALGAQAVLEVPRTEVGNMTLYGTILLTLETMVLSLTQLRPERAMETARRLRDLRDELRRSE